MRQLIAMHSRIIAGNYSNKNEKKRRTSYQFLIDQITTECLIQRKNFKRLLQSGFYSWLESNVGALQHFLSAPGRFNKVLFGGLLGSWFSLLQFVTMPVMGALSDVYGRKPLLLASLVAIAASYLLWSLSSATFVLFVASRTLGGLSKGNVR